MEQEERMREVEQVLWDTINQQMWDYLRERVEYQELINEENKLLGESETVTLLLEGRRQGAITLSETETLVLEKALRVAGQKEEIERKELYYLGYIHCYRLAQRMGIL
ncbi:hypothetical protein NE619_18280 [Anaerovorax odorimutans]|uniref:Uncharacterized protein n=1 Tax=Anaerovorax odorimutans TaxID=109327 RepID=A0ABT1RTY5_9FIRM|nr:hypothetical protein [Anaerovorax odorimutans]MCQ4638677.1 hypothetical protein [Anaerovorax odorimutans]